MNWLRKLLGMQPRPDLMLDEREFVIAQLGSITRMVTHWTRQFDAQLQVPLRETSVHGDKLIQLFRQVDVLRRDLIAAKNDLAEQRRISEQLARRLHSLECKQKPTTNWFEQQPSKN